MSIPQNAGAALIDSKERDSFSHSVLTRRRPELIAKVRSSFPYPPSVQRRPRPVRWGDQARRTALHGAFRRSSRLGRVGDSVRWPLMVRGPVPLGGVVLLPAPAAGHRLLRRGPLGRRRPVQATEGRRARLAWRKQAELAVRRAELPGVEASAVGAVVAWRSAAVMIGRPGREKTLVLRRR